ncbi:Tfp pilus assembly protein FimT/FimU [Gemmatimonas sp.]|uniref:Tfp pilus assembly protein FimT/FimU n=1 Tax=Gemmatimonas sp. TaxID=1962908 RepID=UPI0037BF9445
MIEQLLIMAILAVVSTLMVASGLPLLQAAAVETATRETADLLAYARDHAVAASTRTAVRFDAPRGDVLVHVGPDTIARGSFARTGVQISASRDSMAYAPSGLGVGAANLRIILSLGARADTITVSRLGRVSVQ